MVLTLWLLFAKVLVKLLVKSSFQIRDCLSLVSLVQLQLDVMLLKKSQVDLEDLSLSLVAIIAQL